MMLADGQVLSVEVAPLEIYSHALKGNKNIIHIAFSYFDPNWLQATICDLPWVTSISFEPQPTCTRHPP
jgi:hypothetical protein